MKNRLAGVVIGQIIGIIIVCMISTFIALVSFGGIAGVTIASDPEGIFKLAAPLSCPKGKVDFQKSHATYNRPGENEFNVDCVAPDGTKADVTLPSIGYALLGFYLACFVPLCVPGGLAALVIPLFFLRGGKKKEPSTANVIGTL